MMDRVMLRPLDKIAHPMRSPEIAVIEILSDHRENVEPRTRGRRCSQQGKHHRAREHRVEGNFNRVLVKRGKKLDSAGTVMDLVANAPQEIDVMARAMPPIKDECANEPAQSSLQKWRHQARNVEHGPALEPSIPGYASQQDDPDLTDIQEGRTEVPTGRLRKLSTGKDSLERKEKERCSTDKYERSHKRLP